MSGKLPFRVIIAVILALAVLLPATSLAAPPARSNVIVVFKDSVANPGAAASEMAERHGARVGFVYQHALKGFSAEVPTRALLGISRDPRVAFIETDQLVHAFEVPTGVDRIEADKDPTADIGDGDSVNVDVAIIDTGIDADHPDLNIAGGVNCTGGIFFASCKSGGYDDGNGHGTHVAGTVGALDNGQGVVGVAPGARLWAVKVLDNNGSGYMSWIVAGIDWVTANAGTIEVANMSLGCECSSSALDNALYNSTDAGVVHVVAAGNSASDASTFSPAKHPEVIATSAVADYDGLAGGAADPTCRNDVGADDTFATFSNYGSVVDIAAPGVCIESTWPGGGYHTISGTSMASPHAAGAAALYIVENNTPRNSNRWSAVRNGLQSSGWSVPQSDPCAFTGGKSSERFLLLEACDFAGDPGDPADNPPSVSVTNPASGAIVSGTVTIAADASDDNGVQQVEFFVDGASIGADTNGTDGWSASWDTTAYADGDYTVSATATDTAGQTASDSVSVTVDNPDLDDPPTVSIFSPGNGATVSGSVTIQVDADDSEDAIGTLAVQVSIGGGSWQAATYNGTSGYYEFVWDTTAVADGNYTIDARATDSASNTTDATQISVTLDNSPDEPTAPSTMHVGDLSGSSINNGSTWTAVVTILVLDDQGNPVASATVSGSWGGSASGNASCTTGSDGACSVSVGGIHKRNSSVTFTVTGVTHGSLTYDSSANVESSIVVNKP